MTKKEEWLIRQQIPTSVTAHEAMEKLAEWLREHPEDAKALRERMDQELRKDRGRAT